uniref:Innexin n=1 Tax=Meloidogyne hapla TaxID=6305 RepID=A0A1I8BZ57_MELHA
MQNNNKIFKYSLNKIEINFYFFIWILHSLIAFIISIIVSSKHNIGNWLDHWLEPSSYISGYFIDNSDIEWKLFKKASYLILTTYLLNSIVSIAYVAGQLFHLKYYIIFGIPSIFAKIDGMQPNPSPICISHVAKYSQMWRYFDRGLYLFLKNQVKLMEFIFSFGDRTVFKVRIS